MTKVLCGKYRQRTKNYSHHRATLLLLGTFGLTTGAASTAGVSAFLISAALFLWAPTIEVMSDLSCARIYYAD